MKIAHVLTCVEIGGGEGVALMLAAAQVRAGHGVSVLSFEEPPEGGLRARFEAARVTVSRFPKRPGFDVRLSAELLAHFRRESFDVVHTHNPLPLIYAALPARAAGARVVHTKHGPHPARSHRLWLRRLGSLAVDAFVAVSDDTAAFASAHFEVRSGKLHVVQNGIDVERFVGQAERRLRQRASWGIEGDVIVFGTVGRMAPVKNHALLLRALAPLLGPRCRLVIAGDGPERANTEALIHELDVGRWVHVLGAIDDVPAVLAGIDVFALSSHVEGLPLAVMEAMACCLPVVATSVGGVPKVVEDGRTGLLVPPGDERALRAALSRLKDAPLERARFGEAGRRLAEREFTSSRMLDDYMTLYRSAGAGDSYHGW